MAIAYEPPFVDSNGKFQDGLRTSVMFPPSTGAVMTMAYGNAANLTSIVAKNADDELWATNFLGCLDSKLPHGGRPANPS